MSDKPFQRKGAKSNAFVGKNFEIAAQKYFSDQGLELQQNVSIPIGIGSKLKPHAFDLGSIQDKIIVECKSHKWTVGENIPSAKLTVWNEAMYYLFVAPKKFRKILFVLKDYSLKRKSTLAEYYIKTYSHLIPDGVEIWEYDENKKTAECLKI